MQVLVAVTAPDEPLIQRVQKALQSCADVWPRLEQSAMWIQRSDRVAVLALGADDADQSASRHCSGDTVVAMDGLAIHNARMMTAADLATMDLGTSSSPLEGVFFAIRGNLASGTIEVVTDPLGMQMVFVAKVGNSWIAANNAIVLLRIIAGPRWNMDGVRLLLTFAGTGHGRSLFENIRIVPCGHRWSWKPGQTDPIESRYFGTPDLASIKPTGLSPSDLKAACDEMREQVLAAAATGRPLRAPITGGRDSRVLAAIVAKAGVECDFFTAASKGSPEERVALEVAKVLGVRHRIEHPKPASIIERWDELTRRLLLQNDGYVNVWQVGNAAAQDDVHGPRAIVLGGHGGEFTRHPFGNIADWLPGRMSLRSVSTWLPIRMVDSLDGLVRADAVDWSHQYVRTAVQRLADEGWDSWNIADGIAYFERQRTRDASAIRPGNPVRDMLLPFYIRSYVRLSFEATIYTRYQSQVHEMLLDLVAPELRRVPYSQLPKSWHRPMKDVASRINRFLKSDQLRKKKVRTSSQQSWIASMLPRIRQTCLDAASSRLWETIDRSTFERFTSESEASRLAARADGILRVYSFFEYARLAEVA